MFKQGEFKEMCCSQKGDNGVVAGKKTVSEIPVEKLYNINPSRASMNGWSEHFCLHSLWQSFKLKRENKKSTFFDCVCFVVKPMSCLGRLGNMKMCTVVLKSKLLWSGLTLQLTVCTAWLSFSLALWIVTPIKHSQTMLRLPEKSPLIKNTDIWMQNNSYD